MLLKEREQSMSRKEYLKKLKLNKKKFPYFKHIIISIVMIILFIYVIQQLHVYNTVTEMANKVVEESKLIKTYKMYFMGLPYEKDATENILYLYTGTDESRLEIEAGQGLKDIQLYDNYIYGLKDNNLIKIDLNTYTVETVCEGDVYTYNISDAGLFVYRYNKNDGSKTGIYKIEEKEELIINTSIYQMLVDEHFIYVVAKDSTEKTLIRYTLDGKNKKALTSKITVYNIIQDKDNIYYINNSDKNKIYMVSKDGTKNYAITKGSSVIDTSKYNGNHLASVIEDKVIYINSVDNKVYVCSNNEEKILVDNEIKYIQLNGKMLYVALKNKIEIHRLNIETSELEKITSARFSEFIFENN